jgi:hypothetical protein
VNSGGQESEELSSFKFSIKTTTDNSKYNEHSLYINNAMQKLYSMWNQ